jgi:hypothetical protein
VKRVFRFVPGLVPGAALCLCVVFLGLIWCEAGKDYWHLLQLREFWL